MRKHNNFKLSCGGQTAVWENAMDVPAVLAALSRGENYAAFLCVGTGLPAPGETAVKIPAAYREAETVEISRDLSGCAYLVKRAVFTDEDLPPGTFVSEAGFTSAPGKTTYSAASLSGPAVEKKQGEDLVVEGRIYLEIAGCRGGEADNPLSSYFLSGEQPQSARILLHRCGEERLAGTAAAVLPALCTLRSDGIKVSGEVLQDSDFSALSVEINGRRAAVVCAPQEEVTEDLSGRTSFEVGGQAEYLRIEPAATAACYPFREEICEISSPAFAPELSGTDDFFTSLDERLLLTRCGGRFLLYEILPGRLNPLPSSGMDEYAERAVSVQLSKEGFVFLLLKDAPYLKVFRRGESGFTPFPVEKPELMKDVSELCLAQEISTVCIRQRAGSKWNILEYLYITAGESVKLTRLYQREYVDPEIHLDRISGCRLYIDRPGKSVVYKDTFGISYLISPAVKQIAYAYRELVADTKFLYVTSPTLMVFDVKTGAPLFADGQEVCRTVLSPCLRYLVKLYGDDTFAAYWLDKEEWKLTKLGEAKLSGRARRVLFIGDNIVFLLDGETKRQAFALIGKGFRIRSGEPFPAGTRLHYLRARIHKNAGDTISWRVGCDGTV